MSIASVYADYEAAELPNEGRYDGEISDIDIVRTKNGFEMVKIEYIYDDPAYGSRIVEEWLRWDPADERVTRRFFKALSGLGVTGDIIKQESPDELEDLVNILRRETMGYGIAVVVHVNNGYVNVRGYRLRGDNE